MGCNIRGGDVRQDDGNFRRSMRSMDVMVCSFGFRVVKGLEVLIVAYDQPMRNS